MKKSILLSVLIVMLSAVHAVAQTAATNSCGFTPEATKSIFYEVRANEVVVQETSKTYDRVDCASTMADAWVKAERTCANQGFVDCVHSSTPDPTCVDLSPNHYSIRDYVYGYTARMIGTTYKKRDDRDVRKLLCARLDQCELININNGDALNALNRMSDTYECHKR